MIADGYVRCAGERVAAVAADDEDICQQALDLIEVEYEELTPLLDVEEAMKPDAPILHPDFNTYQGFRPQEKPSNVYRTTHYEQGNVEQGFAEADFIFEGTYVTQRRHQGYLEPQSVLVNIRDDGRVDVWLCSKVPYNTRESLATAARLPEDSFVFHQVYIGGDFGGKGNSRNTPVAYYLAKFSGRPVRVTSDYLEEFGAGNPRHHTVTKLKTGVKRDGTITAHTVMYIVNSGAYAAFKPMGTIGGANQAAGPYRIPNCSIDSALRLHQQHSRRLHARARRAQGVFAIESHLDEMARQMGMDPLEFRLKNLVGEMEQCAFGEEFEHCRAAETLRPPLRRPGYKTNKDPQRRLRHGDRRPRHRRRRGHDRDPPLPRRPASSSARRSIDQGSGTHTTLVAGGQRGAADSTRTTSRSRSGTRTSFYSTPASPAAARTRVNSIAAHAATVEIKQELLKLAVRRLSWPEERAGLERRRNPPHATSKKRSAGRTWCRVRARRCRPAPTSTRRPAVAHHFLRRPGAPKSRSTRRPAR